MLEVHLWQAMQLMGNFETITIPSRGACAVTERTPPVWWQVDLLEVYEITKVAITARRNDRKSYVPTILN